MSPSRSTIFSFTFFFPSEPLSWDLEMFGLSRCLRERRVSLSDNGSPSKLIDRGLAYQNLSKIKTASRPINRPSSSTGQIQPSRRIVNGRLKGAIMPVSCSQKYMRGWFLAPPTAHCALELGRHCGQEPQMRLSALSAGSTKREQSREGIW